MKKRMISMLLVLAMVLPVFCLRALAWSGVGEGDGIAWELDENGVLTLSGEGEMEHHSPAGAGWGSWVNKNIAAVTKWSVDASDIKAVIIKSGITIVGDAAFSSCYNNLEAVIEEGVVEIGYHAFLDNTNLAKVTIPASVTLIQSMAFLNCESLTDVYYGGTEAMWNAITVRQYNDALLNATIHFADGSSSDKTEEEPEETVPEETVPEETVPEDTVPEETVPEGTVPEEKPEAPKPAQKFGDATGDGKVNYEDALLALRYSIGLEELSDEMAAIADVTGDGKVNYEDALKILRVSIGLDTLEPPKENYYDDPNLVRGLMDYENTYIRQHLAFIDSAEYNDMLLIPGGLAGALTDTYEEAKLNIVNGIWTFIDKVKMAVGDGEIELVNEYELLVSLVMQGTGSEENFLGSYEENYFGAVLELVSGLNKQLKDCKDNVDFFTGESIEKVEELTEKLDQIIVKLQTLDGVPEKDAKGLFADAMEEVKKAFDEDFIKENEAFLTAVKEGLSIALDVTDLVSKSITEVMDTYILYTALSGATEEWDQVWSDIAKAARKYDDEVGDRLADAIEKVLEQTRAYQEDATAALLHSSVTITGENLVEFAYSQGFAVFDGMMKKSPMCTAVRTGLVAGVELSNAFTGMDEIAYHGKMMAGYGHLAKIAFEIMRLKGEALIWDSTYENALLYDMAFNIYRNTQLASIESAINYCQAMATAHAANAQLSSEKAMEASMLLPHKLTWEGYKCHGITLVDNNGGCVVGYNGNVYYFRIAPGAYNKSATFGNYSVSEKIKNDLVVRTPDGTEKVIFSTESSGNIWICSGRILYKKADGYWYYVDMHKPEKENKYTKASIIGYIQQEDMLVLQASNGKVYTADTRGNEVEIVQGDYTAITVHDGYYYHYSRESTGKYGNTGNYTFYRYNLTQKETEVLGTIYMETDVPSNWWATLPEICVGEDGFYVLAGYVAGTGQFFQEGSIYYLPFGGQMELLVSKQVKYPMMYLAGETQADGTVKNRYLYYYTTGDVVGVDLYQGAQDRDVSRYDIQSGTTEQVTFPLCSVNEPFIYNGKLMILEGGLEPTVLLDAATAKAIGCGNLGFREDGSAAYHERVEKVGDDWYILMVESVEDDTSSLGWRQGYAWNFINLFRYSPETGQWELIHSCT